MRKVLMLVLVLPRLVFALPSAVDDLNYRIKELKSMKANFKQVVKEGGHITQKTQGVLFLKRPGRFRWQTNKPMPQLIVSDSKTLWIYDEDLEQVTIKKISKQLKGTPALFLSGYDSKLSQQYSVQRKQVSGKVIFTLYPKNKETNGFLRLMLHYQGNQLMGLSLKDKLGQETFLSFAKVQNNPQLSDTLFHFSPPKGVDIVTQ